MDTTTINGVVVSGIGGVGVGGKKKKSPLSRESSFRGVLSEIYDVGASGSPSSSSSSTPSGFKSLVDVIPKGKSSHHLHSQSTHSNFHHHHHSVSLHQSMKSVPYSRSSESRASYNERRSRPSSIQHQHLQSNRNGSSNGSLNSSKHPPSENHKESPLREYGSHGSLDVLSRINDPPPMAVSTLQRKTAHQGEDGESAHSAHSSQTTHSSASPKSKKKHFFNEKSSLFKKLRGHPKESEDLPSASILNHQQNNNNNNHAHHNNNITNVSSSSSSSTLYNHHQKTPEDRHRRRFFAHYDIASVCASLSPSGHLKTLERRNTTTGASAASAALRLHSRGGGDPACESSSSTSVTPSSSDADQGDHISNQLVLSCPYFRNEVGGEVERNVALSRETCTKRNSLSHRNTENSNTTSWHTPAMARGFSLLDNEESYWKNGFCPYRRVPAHIVERVDEGASFFKKHFYGKEHQNWFGIDDNLGAVAISIRREKVSHDIYGSGVGLDDPMKDQYMYRVMVRSSELLPLRGCVLEESIPALKSEKIKTIPTKEVLEFICPELTLSSLHLGVQSGPCEEELIKLDEAYVHDKYKVGLMYCREGQQTEEEMYNNEEGGAAFNEFLEMIGQKVRLKGFSKYKAGLCNKNDSTGLYSVYTEHENGSEIMFHVSTLLPFTNSNRQQLPRKRYIGNDIVTVVFQEPGALPFIPNIKSQFQHVFIVVQAHNPCSENTQYSVAVSRSKSVPMFGPPIPEGAMFPKSKAFANFLLTKIINAENAAHHSDKFVSMAIRTRQELLKDLASNFSTQTTLESGSKFSIFGPKKKDKLKPRFSPDASLRGALSWRVVAEDCLTRQEVYAFVAISADSIVLVLDNIHRDVMFVTATKSILGWTALANSIRIYFHQGEALILHSKDWETEDMSEIAQRLKAVTIGAPTQEFTLRRNQMGQLGFHVQHDGLITEVENYGYAWQTGLRQGSRLVEICKHHVSALSHEHMVDLLKTSMTVTVTVIPPHPDGSPRVGCNLGSCPHPYGSSSNSSSEEGDYENLGGENNKQHLLSGSGSAQQQEPSNGKMCYERSVSPPRSTGSSSGYGTTTGSTNRKSLTEARFPPLHSQENTLTSSSSGHSSDERWYDFSDHNHHLSTAAGAEPNSNSTTPPPLPNRVLSYPVQPSQQLGLPSVYPPRTSNPASNNNNASAGTTSSTSSSSSYPYFDPSTGKLFEYGEEKRSNDAKVTYLTEYELNQPSSSSNKQSPLENHLVLQHERLAALKTPSSSYESAAESLANNNNDERIPTPHSHSSTSATTTTQRSEDELSASSISLSPQRLRRTYGGGSLTPSSQGSRNHSPKNVLLRSSYDGSDAQPKKKVVSRSSNRHSANLNSNTLQENLMKLIGPELSEDNTNRSSRSSSSSSTNTPASTASSSSSSSSTMKAPDSSSPGRTPPRKLGSELSLIKSRSRENISQSLTASPESANFFHMARPATVLSNSPPNHNTNAKSSIGQSEDNKTDQKDCPNPSTSTTPLPLPDSSREMDWTSLVDTATKAIITHSDAEPSKDSSSSVDDSRVISALMIESSGGNPVGAKSILSSISEKQMRDLVEKVHQLESRLNSQSQEKISLEEEIASLREENLRLQEESQTAAQQLRRFTEWFFQTIDKN